MSRSTISTLRRTGAAAFAMAGAIGLAACGSDGSSVSTPSGSVAGPTSTSGGAPTSSSSMTSDTSTASSSDTSSDTSTESSTTESSTESSSSTSTQPVQGNPKVTPDGTNLKFGKSAIVKSDTYGYVKVTVKALRKAPAKALVAANLNASGGNIYYVDLDYTYLGGAKYSPSTGFAVSYYDLRPVTDSTQKIKIGGGPQDDLPGCKKTEYDSMSVGDSASSCYYYQLSGDAPTKVTYDDYDTQIVWSK